MRRASTAVCSRSPWRQKKRHSTSVAPASLPAALSPSRISAVTLSTDASGVKFTNAPSPSSPASRSIFPRSAAMTIGTCSSGGMSSLKPPPARSPASAARRNSTASRVRVSGFSNGIPFQRSTMTFDEEPMPRQKRPPESCCSDAACWASTAGPRVKTLTTPVPTRIRSVAIAATVTGVKPSCADTSPGQPSVKPASSATFRTGGWSGSFRPGMSSDRPQRLGAGIDEHPSRSPFSRLPGRSSFLPVEASDREAVASGGGAGTAVLDRTDGPSDEQGGHEEEHSRLPHLWAERPLPARLILATVPPAAFGALCGWALAVITAVVGALMGRLGANQRRELEEPGPYVDFKRVSRAELIGMVSGVVLLASLWLPWFATSADNPHSRINTANIGPGHTANAWQTFRILDVLLVLAFLAPFILAWIIAQIGRA